MTGSPRVIDFLLLPDFPLYAVVPATEALRIANQNAGSALYDWRFVSARGGAVRASNGMTIEATQRLATRPAPDWVIVCGGNEPTQHLDAPLLAALRRLAAHGVLLGALDTGAFALAAAGVIRDRRITLHWEAIPPFRDRFPNIAVAEQIFVIDRDLLTAAGGVASLDLMLAVVGRAHGERLARVVADAFVHGHARAPETRQREMRAEEHPIIRRAVRLMAENVGFRLEIDALCDSLAVSRRGLERAFQRQTGRSPAATYMDIRLQAARDQLFYSGDSIAHIAEATGFQSNAHFSRAFRAKFGAPPTSVRRSFEGAQRSRYHPTGTRLLEER